MIYNSSQTCIEKLAVSRTFRAYLHDTPQTQNHHERPDFLQNALQQYINDETHSDDGRIQAMKPGFEEAEAESPDRGEKFDL